MPYILLMRITETVPGSFVVTYSYSEKKGARRQRYESSVAVSCSRIEEAEAAAHTRRGHLENYTVLSVGPETSTRNATRAEEAEAGARALEAIRARRAATGRSPQ